MQPWNGFGGLLVVLTLVLSGCSGGGDTKLDPSATTPPEAGLGAIAGLVTNNELEPLPGAQIALQGGAQVPTTTNAEGQFYLNDLQPGRHVVYVQALGYRAMARSVEVAPDQVVEVTFALAPIPIETPYSTLEFREGFIQCGTGTPAVTQVICGDPGPTPTNQKFLFKFNVTEGVSGLLIEMAWSPTQTLSRDLTLVVEKDECAFDCTSNDVFGEVEGCCALRLALGPGDLSLPDGARDAVDLREGGVVQTRTFPAFGEEGVPATLFLDQQFEIYVEAFYNGLPADWETRSNLPD